MRNLSTHDYTIYGIRALFCFLLFFNVACEDNDDDHDHDDDHTDADGFVLENVSGTEVYREFEGASEGSITLSAGDTLELSVHFLDHDEEEHGMAIHVIGVSAGSTSFQLQLMHEGHADYTSTNNVPVVVN